MNEGTALIAFVILAIVMFSMGAVVATDKEQSEFVQTECAQYNPLTSKFEIIEGTTDD